MRIISYPHISQVYFSTFFPCRGQNVFPESEFVSYRSSWLCVITTDYDATGRKIITSNKLDACVRVCPQVTAASRLWCSSPDSFSAPSWSIWSACRRRCSRLTATQVSENRLSPPTHYGSDRKTRSPYYIHTAFAWEWKNARGIKNCSGVSQVCESEISAVPDLVASRG